MRASILLSLFVACAVSTPLKRDVVDEYVVVTKTVTQTAGAPESTPPPPPARVYTYTYGNTYTYRFGQHGHKHSKSSPAETATPIVEPTPIVQPQPVEPSTTPEVEPVPSPKPTSTPPPPSTPTPKPSPTPVAQPATSNDDGSPLSDNVSCLTTVNKYRKLYNLNDLTWSSKLAGNAQKTGDDGQGVNQNHELNPGTYGQVITPGTDHKVSGLDYGPDSPFELSYAAWLCEVKDLQLLSPVNQCDLVQNNLHMEYSSSGHHDILTSSDYKSIGCGFAKNPKADATSPYQGLWVCDLGY